MLKNTRLKIERMLRERGFQSETARMLLTVQIITAVFSMIAGLLLLPLTKWAFAFGVGACLATIGFWNLCRISQTYITMHFDRRIWLQLFIRFNLRLAFTGAVLFTALVILRLPLFPLIAGLAISMVCVLAWGLNKAVSKPIKES